MNLFKLPNPEKHDKVEILAYSDKELKTDAHKKFTAQFNPATLSMGFANDYVEVTLEGGAKEIQYKGEGTSTLTMDFLFDFSGAAADVEKTYSSVYEAVEAFKDTCWKTDGKIHQPYFLKVVYGTVIYSCKLVSYNLTLTVFRPDGLPIRGKIAATFKNFEAPELRAKIINTNSPDLTHKRSIEDYKGLTAISNNIYGQNDLYVEVARANDFNTFRGLKTGTTVFFPPTKKSE